MNTVQTIPKTIASAFVKAQAAFGPALKTSDNPHFRSKYAGLDACIEAVIDALHANGIALMQRNVPCESGVSVETILLHTSGETISGGILHVPASKQDAQGYGSALTYARRYGILTLCGIAPEDDDGNAASRPTTYAKPAKLAPRVIDEPINVEEDKPLTFDRPKGAKPRKPIIDEDERIPF
jgi:hypothetical protein